MSGHKHATITARAENIRQLSQTEMAVRFVEAGLNELSARLDQYARQDREADGLHTQAAQEILIQTLGEVDEAFGALEEQTQIALTQQQDQFYEQLNSLNEYSEQANAEKLEQISEQYQSALEELSHFQDESITILSEKLERIARGQKRKNFHIIKWLEAVNVLYQSIEHDPFIEIVSPGFLEESTESIRQAQANLAAGYAEAALVIGQNTYRAISQVKIRAQQERQQYQNLTFLLHKKLQLLEQEVLLNQSVHAFDLQGNTLPNEIAVDEWVEGNLSRLHQKIQAAQTLVEKPVSIHQIDKLKKAIKHIIPLWHKKLDDFVYQARAEAINSQLRMNIALMVVRSLSSQGYRLVQTQYNNEDMRAEYLAQLVDDEGSQVLIQVEAGGSQPETAELNLFTQDADKRTPHELKQRSKEIQRSISRAGLRVSELKPVEQATQNVHNSQERVKDGQQRKQLEQFAPKR
jgi:hypothetical protein